MIKLFYKLFNHNKIDDLNITLDVYKERNKQLEDEIMKYKGYKLKYEVTKLYVEDDDALLELFELAKKVDAYNSGQQGYGSGIQAGIANIQLGQAAGLAALQQAQAGQLQRLRCLQI